MILVSEKINSKQRLLRITQDLQFNHKNTTKILKIQKKISNFQEVTPRTQLENFLKF